MKPAKPSRTKRAARVVRLGASLAGSYLAYQVQRPFIDEQNSVSAKELWERKSAAKIRQELQQLRGPIMKLGQALSMQSHLLGPEAIRELSALQMQAPPMHPTLMRVQFKSSLGAEPEKLFKSFDPAPFAAASLGQVHSAVTREGEPVVVKIQYPAIRDAIESDFRLLRTAGFAARLSGHVSEAVISEIERGILEETDYRIERQNIESFQKSLAPLPFVRVPKVYPELGSDQVLTMSRLPGLTLPEFIKTKPPQALRDRLGVALTNLFYFQLFRVQALHSDPHPGNYLFNQDGTISLVDFGCVKKLKPEVVRCYVQFWSREWVHDDRLFIEIIRVIFGKQATGREPHIRRSMLEISRFYDYFHPLDRPDTVLELADPKFMAALTELAKVLFKNKFLSPEFVFLSRTESGMCNLLHILGARVPTTKIARAQMQPAELRI